jgi:hypothetical protein
VELFFVNSKSAKRHLESSVASGEEMPGCWTIGRSWMGHRCIWTMRRWAWACCTSCGRQVAYASRRHQRPRRQVVDRPRSSGARAPWVCPSSDGSVGDRQERAADAQKADHRRPDGPPTSGRQGREVHGSAAGCAVPTIEHLQDVQRPRGGMGPAGADYYVRAGQAACVYWWRTPPSRSRRWTSSRRSRSGSLIGTGTGRRGAALCSVR